MSRTINMDRHLLVLFVLSALATAQDLTCRTPGGFNGRCVPISHCSNLYALTALTPNLPARAADLLKQAECNLSGSEKGVCCQQEKVFRLPEEHCGVSPSSRLAFGTETKVFELPWMALLMYRNVRSGKQEGNCGGTLINDRYVLTAAHCLRVDESRTVLEQVRLGEHTLSERIDCNENFNETDSQESDCAKEVKNVGIESIIVHPNYNDAQFSNDIGLIRLAAMIKFEDHIQPICLPMNVEQLGRNFDNYVIAGWGLTEQQEKSNKLLKARVTQMAIGVCQARIDDLTGRARQNIVLNEQRQICTGEEGDRRNHCTGDSGGPLMQVVAHLRGTRYVQFGVISFGMRYCGYTSFPGVYTRVGPYMRWIVANMNA